MPGRSFHCRTGFRRQAGRKQLMRYITFLLCQTVSVWCCTNHTKNLNNFPFQPHQMCSSFIFLPIAGPLRKEKNTGILTAFPLQRKCQKRLICPCRQLKTYLSPLEALVFTQVSLKYCSYNVSLDSEQQTCSDFKTIKESIRKGSELK